MFLRGLQSLQNSQGVGSGQTLGGTQWGQYVNTNPQPARGVVFTAIHTFRPNLIGEFTVGANYIHQMNQPRDEAQYKAVGDLSTFKDASGNKLSPVQIFNGNFQNLIPNVIFSTPTGTNRPQSAGQAWTGTVPAFGFDNRWPFDGTDLQSNYSANFTWIKGSHSLKAGVNWEHGSRDVSVYSVYNTQGSYYFATDTGNPLDTGYPLSNLLLGTIQSFGQDNEKQINHARWNQYEWYLQDSWKVSRRLTLTYGVRFQVIPQIYSDGATLGLFNGNSYDRTKVGQLLFPACRVAVSPTGSCSVANTYAVNPVTGAQYAGSQIGLFDPKSYSGTSPYSGIDLYKDKIFNTEPPQVGPPLRLRLGRLRRRQDRGSADPSASSINAPTAWTRSRPMAAASVR